MVQSRYKLLPKAAVPDRVGKNKCKTVVPRRHSKKHNGTSKYFFVKQYRKFLQTVTKAEVPFAVLSVEIHSGHADAECFGLKGKTLPLQLIDLADVPALSAQNVLQKISGNQFVAPVGSLL